MKRKGIANLFMAVGLFLVVAAGIGCATTDEENLSERPWNTPKSWETGMPQSIMQGR